MNHKLMIVLSIALLLAAGILPAAAAPLATPCAPGAAYNPACDVDHDNDVDIFDIQLAAGHWNQAGVYTSDNDHNHLGQNWTGSNNPLKLTGSYGTNPDNAALVVSNSAAGGNGLEVDSASTGVRVNSASSYGVWVRDAGMSGLIVTDAGESGVKISAAGDDGVMVWEAGVPSTSNTSAASNGFEVAGAQGYGLWVGWAGADGVRIVDASDDGIQIGDGANLPTFGLFVNGPGTTGDTLLPNTSDASGQWALYTTDSIEAANVFASAQTLVTVVGGDQALAPGDVVSAAGLADAVPGSVVPPGAGAPGQRREGGGRRGRPQPHGLDAAARPGEEG